MKKKLPKIGKKVVKSPFEFQLWNQIIDFGLKAEYESEKLPYTVNHTYCPDFVIYREDGTILYIEAKGNGRQFDNNVKQKMIAVKQQHPDKEIRIVFYSDGKCGPKRKDGSFMKQSDWAIKNGFKYSIKSIPEEWMVS